MQVPVASSLFHCLFWTSVLFTGTNFRAPFRSLTIYRERERLHNFAKTLRRDSEFLKLKILGIHETRYALVG